MHPVIISVGTFAITSFGLFLFLAFLAATFAVWRIARVYELSPERIIDLVLGISIISLIGARIYYIAFHLSQFSGPLQMILFLRFSGLSFWGGLIAGIAALVFLTRKFHLNFLQISDFVSLGLLIGLVLGDFGCLLSSCQPGIVSQSFLSVTQVGLIGKRFPIQLFESLVTLSLFIYLWKQSVRFHLSGIITAQTLILLGAIKLITEFFRADTQKVWVNLSLGHIFSLIMIFIGTGLYMQLSKVSFSDIGWYLKKLLTSQKSRQAAISKAKRQWYNLKTNSYFGIKRKWKETFKKLNVKSTPPKF